MELITKRYLTIAEVQKILPEVEKIFRKLVAINEALAEFGQIRVGFEEIHQSIAYDIERGKNFHKLNYELYNGIGQLMQMGAIVKDLNSGLVDFYSKAGSREIFLCWKFGEPQLEYWHELETGFNGRKPISQL